MPAAPNRARTPLRALAPAAFAIPILAVAPASAQFLAVEDTALPPNPQPGECYARVLIPAKTETRQKRVETKQASEALAVEQAQHRWVVKDVEIETAAERVEVTPAKFETRKKTVVIEPAREVVEALPPVYETVKEQVLIRPSYTMWKKGEGPIQKVDLATGEIMCLVTVPAEYKTIERQVVRIPARTVVKTVPAKTEEVEVKVMTSAPQVRRVKIAAKTKPMKVRELVRDWSQKARPIPAEHASVTEIVRVEPQRMAWRPILCETNSKPDLVRTLQSKLKRVGFNPGRIDGKFGPATLKALTAYQKKNGLAAGNVTIETLDKLKIDYKS